MMPLSGRQGLVREVLGLHDAPKRAGEDLGVVSVAVSPLELFEVAVEMLLRDLVEGSDDAALEQAPDALNGVRVDIAHNPFLDGVVDRLMAGVVVCDSEICRELVRVDGRGLVSDGLVDEGMQRVFLDATAAGRRMRAA